MIKKRKDTQAETWGGNEYSIGRNAQVKTKAMAARQNNGKGSGKGEGAKARADVFLVPADAR